MSRKMYKQLGRSLMDEQQRRRSPRISALDSSSGNHRKPSDANQGQVSKENACRIKRNIDYNASLIGTSRLAKQVWRGRDHPLNADQWRSSFFESRKKDEIAITNGKESVMPDKHTLELVLDTLQRRDTYEIFGEPVDPDEVEDYNIIIEEPMDFGTMRAKLHEGMYKNLQQFERDVFLIPENAMRFNTSGSLYFRQARALHELAKKVMNALKMDPTRFELEFSGTRRRSMRKALRDNKSPRCASTAASDVSSQRSTKKIADSFCARNSFIRNAGSSESMLYSCDRGYTYWQWSPSMFREPDSSTDSPQLVLNDGGLGYQESLMLYIKDLGPVAHMVAKRKLLGQHETNCQTGSSAFDAKRFRISSNSTSTIDLTENKEEQRKQRKERICDRHGEEVRIKDRTNRCNAPAKQTGSIKTDKKCGGFTRNPYSDPSSNKTTSYKDDTMRHVVLALENCHSNVAEFKSRNKKTCNTEPVSSRDAASATGNLAQSQPQPHPQFVFDLPFLKARLDQMNNAMKMNGQVLKKPLLNKRGGGETFDPSSICSNSFFLGKVSNPSKDKMEANLALQL